MKTTNVVHWDLDGTLLDSEPLHVRKLIYVAESLNVVLTPADFFKEHTFKVWDADANTWIDRTTILHGAGDRAIYYWALSKNPGIAEKFSLQDWLTATQAYYIEHSNELTLRPGILESLRALKSRGIKHHLVTNATREQILGCAVVMAELKPFIEYVITADDVSKHKPDPLSYQISMEAAVQKYGLCKHIAIEDSLTGAKAGLAAGIRVMHFVPVGSSPIQLPNLEAATSAQELTRRVLAYFGN